MRKYGKKKEEKLVPCDPFISDDPLKCFSQGCNNKSNRQMDKHGDLQTKLAQCKHFKGSTCHKLIAAYNKLHALKDF